MIYKGYIIDIYPVKGSNNHFYYAKIRKPIFNQRVPWLTNRIHTTSYVSTDKIYYQPLAEAKIKIDNEIEKAKNLTNYNMFKRLNNAKIVSKKI